MCAGYSCIHFDSYLERCTKSRFDVCPLEEEDEDEIDAEPEDENEADAD